ncbi:MAG TPA: glycosyl hydrolase family 18 protein [Candidatus Limnocylindrales bacterium]|nr:glycosyl hydrolase family 18 protein [Candidatus Limnocylindrales bacterium]
MSGPSRAPNALLRFSAGLLAGAVLAALLPLEAAAASPGLRPLRSGQIASGQSSEVYGFLPYWLATSATERDLHYDLLSTVSLFSVGIASSGSLVRSGPGYAFLDGSNGAHVITAAHAAGTRVDLTFTSFGMDHNRAFLRSATARARGIKQAVSFMAARGADGATLDFEGLYLKDLPRLTTFVRAFVKAARTRNPLARVSVTVQAGQGGVSMAKAALAGGATRIVIMGYDYRSAGSSTTGSLAPLVRRDGGMSLTWTLDLYKAARVPANRLILALPYYGFTWPTTSKARGATAAKSAYGRAPAYPIRVSRIDVPKGARQGYDPLEATAWMAVYDARAHVWRETYWDTPRSLTAKFGLATSRGLAGVGLWALGDETGLAGYWNAIAKAFGHSSVEPRAAAATSSASATTRAASIAASGPTVTPLEIGWNARLRRWIVSYGAVDRSAWVIGYEVRYRIAGGAWHIVFYHTLLRSLGLPVSRSADLTVQVRATDAGGHVSAWAAVSN